MQIKEKQISNYVWQNDCPPIFLFALLHLESRYMYFHGEQANSVGCTCIEKYYPHFFDNMLCYEIENERINSWKLLYVCNNTKYLFTELCIWSPVQLIFANACFVFVICAIFPASWNSWLTLNVFPITKHVCSVFILSPLFDEHFCYGVSHFSLNFFCYPVVQKKIGFSFTYDTPKGI